MALPVLILRAFSRRAILIGATTIAIASASTRRDSKLRRVHRISDQISALAVD
jgi:hypothetical protein